MSRLGRGIEFPELAREVTEQLFTSSVLNWCVAATNRPIDRLAVLAPAFLDGREPALLLRDMEDREEAVDATELALFAAHLGASSITLLITDPDESPVMRLLAHRLSEAAPMDVWAGIFDPRSRSSGQDASVFYGTSISEDAEGFDAFRDRFTLAGIAGLAGPEAMRWLQPAQRILEKYCAEPFEHILDRQENRIARLEEARPPWRGMLRGLGELRNELAETAGLPASKE